MIRTEVYQGDRTRLLPLFALADDSLTQISGYLARGLVIIARDNDDIVGHVQVVDTDDARVFEIKSLSVRATRRGEGIGVILVDAAIAYCDEHDALSVIVSTATADIGNLRFYQRRGFRMDHVVRDAFGPTTGYPEDAMVDGIPLRDQLFLKRDLR
ncbi:MAG: GNAT family N-acetyltransferase [Gemmatimonadaceae bacterium]